MNRLDGANGFGAAALGTAAPGPDPAVIAGVAMSISRHLTALADGMQAAATAFPGNPTGWHGPAEEVLANLLAAHPERFQAIADGCAGASAALVGHADRLGSAAWMRGQAAQAPAFLADELERRAANLADESAQQAASTLLALARSAPARRSRLNRWLGRLETWRSEVDLGAAEATGQLAGSAMQVAVRAVRWYDPRNLGDLSTLGAQLVDAGRHPTQTAKAMIDWDTWRSNPPRAVGHLVPDLLVTLASGGASAGSRATETIRRGQAAVQAAAARDVLRRETSAAAARSSREALVSRAVQAADRPGGSAWLGEGGTRLSAGQNASAEAFHALSSAREPAITASLREVSRTTNTELAGLRHRLKEVESLKRKLATQRVRTRQPLPSLLSKANDAVRYTVVIDDPAYVSGVRQLAARLEQEGFHHLSPPHNAWHSDRYRGINTTWLDPAGGAAFEVQFHTPDSWRITVETHEMYEESRLPHTPPARRAELKLQIAEAYQAAAIPDGVEALSGSSLPPPSPPDPIILPPDHTVPEALISGIAAELVSAEHPAQRPPAHVAGMP